MRMIFALPLFLVAACSVENDARNDSVTLNYDSQTIENTADDLGNAAGQAASDVGNAASRAGAAIENQVDDIDVDIDVNRDSSGNAT